MRVTHVITRLIVGGAQENTIASVLGLQQKPGLQVDLISGPSTGPEGSLADKLDPHTGLVIVPELVRPIHPLKDFLALRRLEKIFRQSKPQIVHTHSGKAGILGRFAAARAQVPIIVHTIHGPSFGTFQGATANFIFRAAERRAARVTTHFVTVADAMTEQYLAAGIGRREQFTKILSGFPLEPFSSAKNDLQLRARLGLAPDDIVIGKIARLFKLKGHDDLFAIAPELVKQNPRLKFLFVGDGEWREKFERRADELNLRKHFVFTGLIPPDHVPQFVGIMDLLVHLSTREGLPRALPQALAAAKPVVAYDCDGAREVCFDGQNGFLIRPGDLPNLTEKILRLANDATLREQFGIRGQQFVREHFSVEQMVDSLYHLYEKLAAARGIRP
jgi:glycosyltransferase involved in cell wall biosynthesis